MKVKSETEGKNETEIESESAQFLILNFLKLLYFRTYLKQKPYLDKMYTIFLMGLRIWRSSGYTECKITIYVRRFLDYCPKLKNSALRASP